MSQIRYLVEIETTEKTYRYSSAVRDVLEPSNHTYPLTGVGEFTYDVRLIIPKISSKISDSISGTSLLTQYNIELMNDDGMFDDPENLDWFYKTLTLKRSDIDNPTLDDFNTILQGEISYPVVSEKKIKLVVNNTFRSLTGEGTNTFTTDEFPNCPDSTLDRNIPILYGSKKVTLFSIDDLDDTKLFAIDKDYITAVSAVYDSDGISIAFSVDLGTGIITATGGVTADVTGATNNKIGQIITTELENKAGITYDADNWDTTEVNEFIFNDSRVNFYFSGGTIRTLVNNVLKNDNAFLFTKNNGLLTLRQWGRLYNQHTIENWKIMKFPTKNYQDAVGYFNSSVVLNYDLDESTGLYNNQLVIGDDTLFEKVKRNSFDVDLYINAELQSLGNRLIQRFSILSEIISLYSGKPTTEVNLLDSVMLDLTINGRQFSTKTEWIVISVDPAQDIISLEARSGFVIPETFDGTLSQVLFNGFSGILSQPYYDGTSGILSQPISVVEE